MRSNNQQGIIKIQPILSLLLSPTLKLTPTNLNHVPLTKPRDEEN
ncbi:hypothetical protein cce_4026 [Crocosphaera subtropica ATCC 51142]|uniref:Uncharacterized protein n=1 Tax=Crocosphaera subtropica (strain ATCC 51142 / BH68) TaxID=43989 RepID=B1WQS2_CROS5|nr:hypothetical protein cce_4026 [Crocosphaera subtropica ATCC 51142]